MENLLVYRKQSFHYLFNECVDFVAGLGKKNIIVHLKTRNDEHTQHQTPYAFQTSFEGRRYYDFNNHRVATNFDNFLLLSNGQIFSSLVDSEEEVESLSVFFAVQFILDVLNNYTMTDDQLLDNYSLFPDKEFHFFEKLYLKKDEIASLSFSLKISVDKSEEDTLTTEQLLHELVKQLLKEQLQLKKYIKQLPFARISTKIEIYKRLVRAKDYIDSCFSENISLSTLAVIACMSEHHFLRHFKLLFWRTPHQYLTMRRMEEAKFLLKKTNYPVSKVVSMIGMECPSNFGRMFKLYTSHTPRGF